MPKWIAGTLAAIAIAIGALALSLDRHVRYLLTHPPTDTDVLFWSMPQRDGAFRTMDWFSIMAQSKAIAAGDQVLPLPEGDPLSIATDIDEYMAEQWSKLRSSQGAGVAILMEPSSSLSLDAMTKKLADALRILKVERETWRELCNRQGGTPEPQREVAAGISLEA